MSTPVEGGYFRTERDVFSQCALCERRPASMFCLQDDAALCAECDVEVHGHSGKFLFGRHERVPIGMSTETDDFKLPLVCPILFRCIDAIPRLKFHPRDAGEKLMSFGGLCPHRTGRGLQNCFVFLSKRFKDVIQLYKSETGFSTHSQGQVAEDV